jgi:hypothetical protein
VGGLGVAAGGGWAGTITGAIIPYHISQSSEQGPSEQGPLIDWTTMEKEI